MCRPPMPYDWRLRIIARMSSARLLSPAGASAGAATVSVCGAGAGVSAGAGVAAGAGVTGAAAAVDVLEDEDPAGASTPYGR